MKLARIFRLAAAIAVASASLEGFAQSGTWVPLTNQPPVSISTMLLLTDGRVLANEVSGIGTKHWWTLTPDAFGSYVNGTWAQVADSNDDRLYFASGVFADGRVILSGGEYSTIGSEIVNTEIYDPVFNVWTEISPPPGWTMVGDAPGVVLTDGRFFIGQINGPATAIYDPLSGFWSSGPLKMNGTSSEESWTLLPDKTVLSWDCFGHPHSEKFVPSLNQWVDCGYTVSDLVLYNSYETGCGLLMPSGKLFAMGGPPSSGIYAPPPNPADPGTWGGGPVPAQVGGRDVGQEDGPGSILPNGNLLLCLGPVVPGGGSYEGPTYCFEYDGTNLVRVSDPPSSSPFIPNFAARTLILPTGEVMFANGINQCYLYSNLPSPNPAYKPTVLSYSKYMERLTPYGVKGLQFNGVSNGSSYGDECGTATNYPLARLIAGPGTVYYCRTFGHSTMGVQTGNNSVSTNMVVPGNVPAGSKKLQIVANGVGSDTVPAYIVDTTNVISFGIDQGSYVSGGLSELKGSDNQYLVVNSAAGVSQITVKGFVPTSYTVGTLGAIFEGGVSFGGVTQKLEFFNWLTNSYEVIDSRSASTADLSVMPFATGTVSRFVDPTGEVVARITYSSTFSLNFQSRVDRYVWISGP